ncbi:hypothetical protein GCM10010307_14400 [Streptomyces vastus]|uniref:Uncharacterized protein n=1 Tax=Streptomyces vastus TaxID=285451 RepID=A0ABN3QH62_9ACTN
MRTRVAGWVTKDAITQTGHAQSDQGLDRDAGGDLVSIQDQRCCTCTTPTESVWTNKRRVKDDERHSAAGQYRGDEPHL